MLARIVNKVKKELGFSTGRYLVSPEFLSLLVTTKCNFKCQSCNIWQNEPLPELDESAWAEIIKDLSAELNRNTFVEINGGEPLIRQDLTIFIIKELKKHFAEAALNSNGSLINEQTLDELKNAGIDKIKLSFYSLNKSTHDSLRGHASAYEHAKQAIELINRKNIPLEIGLLLTSKNIKEAPELIQYLQTLPNTSIIIQPLDEKVESKESKNQSGNQLPANLWPEKDDVNDFFYWLSKNNKNIKNSPANIETIKQYYLNPANILNYRCFAGQRNLVVYPNGDVSFCFKRGTIGNLKDKKLNEILKNAINERKGIKNCKKYCRIIGCNFSRGLKEILQDKLKKSR